MTEMATASDGAALGAAEASPIRVLIAEDETHLGTILEQFMTARGFFVQVVRDGRTALERLRREPFDVALLDVVMPELDGLEVLRQIRERPRPPEIIVITGNGTIETAMAALRLGAYDVLSKPYRMAEIDALVRRAWEKRMLVRENWCLQAAQRREAPSAILTHYAPFRAVLDMATKFAASPLPVLVTGEPGTGKHRLARLLHEGRTGGPFVAADCARADEPAQLRELFGPVAPAGDEPASVAALEVAARGTVFLHNIEGLGLAAQDRLLAALDAGAFVAADGERQVPVEARIVASSAVDLAALVGSGDFREDLLHRLSAMRVVLPPLRDRRVDIPLLADHFLNPPGSRRVLRLEPDALEALDRYPWPGNVRELRLMMAQAALRAEHGVVTLASLGLPTGCAATASAASTTAAPASPQEAVISLVDLERGHIASVLEQTGWHQGRAAERLGISPKTLYRKIREYGFTRPSGRNP